jgi:hypothetical protein
MPTIATFANLAVHVQWPLQRTSHEALWTAAPYALYLQNPLQNEWFGFVASSSQVFSSVFHSSRISTNFSLQFFLSFKAIYVILVVEATIEATREFKSASGLDVFVEIAKNALREASLVWAENVSKPALSATNIKEGLEFANMHKD